jgi:membrane protein DedA with SNARE-associated domain
MSVEVEFEPDSTVSAAWVVVLLGLGSMVGDAAAVFAEMLWQLLQQASAAVAVWARHVGARIQERQEVRRASRPQQRKVRHSVGV